MSVSSSSASSAIQKRTQLPRILEVDEVPEFTVADSIRPRNVKADDLSFIYQALQQSGRGQIIGTMSLLSPHYKDPMLNDLRDVDMVSRKEEEEFLRAPCAGERPCVNGDTCEARNIEGPPTPFTLVEHLTATQRMKRPADPQMCIMCKRYAANYAMVQAQCEKTDMSVIFNTHGNYVDMPGEYRSEQCLIASPTDTYGVIVPVVSHNRSYYRYEVDRATGIQYFRQDGYADIGEEQNF
jgi:hypothetical protein